MSSKSLKYISLLADLVTILGITGYFTTWLLSRRDAKQKTYDILYRTFQDALIKSDLLSIKDFFSEKNSFNSLIIILKSLKGSLSYETSEFAEECYPYPDWEDIEDHMEADLKKYEKEYQYKLEEYPYMYYVFEKEKNNNKNLYKNIEIHDWSEEEMQKEIVAFTESSKQEKEIIINDMIEVSIEFLFYYLKIRTENDILTDLNFRIILENSIKNISDNVMNKYLSEELVYLKTEIYSIVSKLDEYSINYRQSARRQIEEFIEKDGHPFEYLKWSWRDSDDYISFDTNNYLKEKIQAIENFIYFLERLKENHSKYVTEESLSF